MPLLTLLVLLPLAAALLLAVTRPASGVPRWVALTVSLAEAGLAVGLSQRAAVTTMAEHIGGWWSFMLDGFAVPLVVLTAVLGVIAVLASWNVDESPGAHHALLLGLESAVLAVFLASNLVLFYVAWEAVLIPMFFLIGVWGHENRRHAAMKFFAYTFAGSALMLVGLLLIGSQTGSFGMPGSGVPLAAGSQQLVFWLLAAGFLVKIPAWPLHTWLPDAHVEAPTAGSIMLAGVLLKMGGYGLMRIALPIAPVAARSAAPILAGLGITGIVYGALMALAQADLKRLVAYSSVSHMGFVLLAIAVGTPAALGAAMLGMVSHGLVAGLLFLLVGVLYERTHTREIARLGGLAGRLPLWGTTFAFAALASLGLPGLSGFPGELMTMIEGFGAYAWWMVVPAVGVVLAAAYNLYAVRRVSHGPLPDQWAALPDMTGREVLATGTLAVGIVALGLWPASVLALTLPFAQSVAKLLGGGA
jgi:NADH-quinone oxidoreductase subunit M